MNIFIYQPRRQTIYIPTYYRASMDPIAPTKSRVVILFNRAGGIIAIISRSFSAALPLDFPGQRSFSLAQK